MIESFDETYVSFFDEPDYRERWTRLRDLASADYWTFRVLFAVETLAIVEGWKGPTQDRLRELLQHQLEGGVLGVHMSNLERFILPIWPLEMAKYDVFIYRSFLQQGQNVYRQYFLTSLKLHMAAIVQTWWALETMMNDFAGIIQQARGEAIDTKVAQMLNETVSSLDKGGNIEQRTVYQPIDARVQYIYRLLTGEDVDRQGKEWNDIMTIKNTRDVYQHRLGKDNSDTGLHLKESTAIDGMLAVRTLVARIFEKTPEFADRFIYKYFRFWSCGTDVPFLWDGRCGNGFCLGMIDSAPADAIIALYAPAPNSITLAAPEEDGSD